MVQIAEMFRGHAPGSLSKVKITGQVQRHLDKLSGIGQGRFQFYCGNFFDRYGLSEAGCYQLERNLGDGPNVYFTEKQASSSTYLTNLVALPKEPGEVNRLIFKEKERWGIKLLWEFTMLDLWDRVLTSYADRYGLDIHCPRPAFVYGRERHVYNGLAMSFCNGAIVSKLPLYEDRPHVDKNTGSQFELYPSLAFALGALIRIKEHEGLLHGDFGLRHLLFDFFGSLRAKPENADCPGAKTIPSVFSLLGQYARAVENLRKGVIDFKLSEQEKMVYGLDPVIKTIRTYDDQPGLEFQFHPLSLAVIDLESSNVSDEQQPVKDENEQAFSNFMTLVRSHKRKTVQETVKRSFEDGYNVIERPLGRVPEAAAEQLSYYGFNFRYLFPPEK